MEFVGDNKLIRTRDADLNENFIALGMTVGQIDGVQQGGHSVLFVCIRGELYIYHFNNGSIILGFAKDDPAYNIYYHRKLNFLTYSDDEMDLYISTFKDIQSQSQIAFGFIFDGSFYDPITKKHFSKSGLPELSTCVGFCINVLTCLIIESDHFVEFEDWTNTTEHPDFDRHFAHAQTRFPTITKEHYRKHHRRISPNECTVSAYTTEDDIPIRKVLIDSLLPDFMKMVSTLDPS